MSQRLEVKLYATELIYDVRNKTYLSGQSNEVGDEAEHTNEVLRALATAVGSLRTALGGCLRSRATCTNNILPDGRGTIDLELTMPDNYDLSALDALAAAAHAYLVNSVLAEWYGVMNADAEKRYAALAQSSLMDLTQAAHRRVRPERRDLYDA